MSLLAPKKPIQLVSIQLRYTENETGEVSILKEDEVAKDGVVVETVKFSFRTPTWGDTKTIMSMCSSIGQDGKIAFDGYKFIDARIKKLLVDWSLTDDKEKRLPLTEENIERLPSSVVAYLNEQLEKVTSIAAAFSGAQ